MKHLNIYIAALLFCTSLSVGAQSRHGRGGEGDGQNRRQEMVQRQAESLVDRMSLDDTTAAWFVPLFVEYNEAMAKVRKEAMPSKDKAIDALSDEDAEQLIEDAFASEEKVVQVKRDYYERFKQRLTAQQLVKVFTFQPGSQRGQRGQQGSQQGGRGGFGGPGFGPEGPGFGGPGFGGPGF